MSIPESLLGRTPKSSSQEDAAATPLSEIPGKKTPRWLIVFTCIAGIVLLVLGASVLFAGWEMWQDPGSPKVSRPTKVTFEVVKGPVKVTKKNGVTRRRLSAIKRTKVVERSSQSGWSEALALATLASGVALLLAGAFAPRLTKIKLPGVKVEAESTSSLGEVARLGYLVTNTAREEHREDVLADPEKYADAVKMTAVLAGFPEEPTVTLTAPLKGEQQLLRDLTTINEEELQKAAEAAVQTVSEETTEAD